MERKRKRDEDDGSSGESSTSSEYEYNGSSDDDEDEDDDYDRDLQAALAASRAAMKTGKGKQRGSVPSKKKKRKRDHSGESSTSSDDMNSFSSDDDSNSKYNGSSDDDEDEDDDDDRVLQAALAASRAAMKKGERSTSSDDMNSFSSDDDNDSDGGGTAAGSSAAHATADDRDDDDEEENDEEKEKAFSSDGSSSDDDSDSDGAVSAAGGSAAQAPGAKVPSARSILRKKQMEAAAAARKAARLGGDPAALADQKIETFCRVVDTSRSLFRPTAEQLRNLVTGLQKENGNRPGKCGQCHHHLIATRPFDTAQYPRNIFDHKSVMLLAHGLQGKLNPTDLENAGIGQLRVLGSGVNTKSRDAISHDGYNGGDNGCVYLIYCVKTITSPADFNLVYKSAHTRKLLRERVDMVEGPSGKLHKKQDPKLRKKHDPKLRKPRSAAHCAALSKKHTKKHVRRSGAEIDRTHQCPFCTKAYAHAKSLRAHKKTMH